MTKRSESEARRHSVQAPLGQRVVSAAMSALLVFSMWPTGATRALAEAIAPQDSQEAVEEVYEPEAQEQAVAEGLGANGAQAADEAQAAAAAEAEAAAAAEAEQAAADQAAAEQAAAEQAAAEAEANRQVNVGIDVPNATLHYNGQAFSAPTESITVPVHAAFVFSVAPIAGYDLRAVKTLVNGQETELHADAQGFYTVSEATLDSSVTVKVITEPTAQPEPAPAPEVVAPAGDASQGQDAVAAPADEPKTDEGAADTIAPSEGSAATTEGETPAGNTAAGANGAATVAETGNGDADVNAVAAIDTEQNVVAATSATSVSISGENSVTQFSTLQLTAVTDPANADGTASWTSSNEAILTVDESGLVTGLRQGAATVSLTFANADGSSVIATKDITVEAVTEATDQAGVYYLLDPTKDANSNDTGNWGPQYGIATVNVTGATWSNDKNCFDNVDQRVISWPNGTNVVPKDSAAWNQIYENYKSVIQAQLPGVEITKDDVEEISLVPAKISKNNNDTPDKHLDCNVSIKCKNVVLVKYYLRDAGSTQFAQLGSKNYVKGNETKPADVNAGNLPATKDVNGVTYTFSGWYLDQSFTQPVTFPYVVNDSTNFYAKYVGGYQVIYKLEGGTWGGSDATMYTAPEGSTQTVRHEPTRENYKFTGWTVTGLDNVTTLASSATFTMPSRNVTLTAMWEPLVSYQVKYLENGTNKELAPADTHYGELGEDRTETAKTIDGYHLIADCPAEYTHTIGEGDNTVVFLYKKDAVNYTVNYYLNGTETKVADSSTKSAPWGSVVSAADCVKTIDGYTVVPGQDATITVERDGSSVINIYYYKNVSLTANSDTKTYNGTEQSVSGFTGAPEGADFKAITVGAAGTNVGTYTATFAEGTVGTVDATRKYIVTEAKNGSLLITPYADEIVIKIKGATDSKTYGGSEQSVEGFTVESISTKLITENQVVLRTDVAARATGIDAGTYKMGLAGTSFTLADGVSDNFTSSSIRFDVTDGALTITKRPVTLKSVDLSKEYDGTALVNGTTPVEVSGDGWAEGEGASYAFTGSQTVAGSSANAFTYTLNSNTKAENYTITKDEGTLKVTPVADKVTVTIAGNSKTEAYDGTEKSVTGYTVASISNSLYKQGDFAFAGEAVAKGTAKGTYTMGLNAGQFSNTSANFSNVEFIVEDGTLTVTPKGIAPEPGNGMAVGALPDVVYNGAEQAQKPTVKDGDAELVEGVDYDLTYSEDLTNAGTVTVTVTGKGNYDGSVDVTYQILKRQVVLTSGSDTWAYDGKAHSLTVVSGWEQSGDKGFVDGEVADVRATGTVTYVADGKVTNAIAYTELAGFKADNYEIAKHEGTLEVTPATGKVTVTITERGGSYTYDGTEKSAEGYDFVASDPLYTQADFAFTGDATVRGIDAGTYEMQLKSSDFANTNSNFADVEFVVVDNELTIAKRAITLTSADGAKVYDGIALTKNEQSDVAVTGGEGLVAGETLAYEISGTQTAAGSSENTFVATSSETAKVDNYDVTYVYGTLTVTAQSIVLDPENPDTFKGVTVDDPADSVYNGQQHKWLPVVTDAAGNALVEGEDYTVSYDKDDFTNVTGDITVTITGMGNYTGTVTKTYKITKAPLVVAALSASKVYDRSALTAGGTIDGLVADETAQAVTSGSQTEVGSSANAVDSIAWGTALESNYYIASQVDGTLTVTPKGIAPEPGNGMAVGALPDVVYNGAEQAQKPTVKDGDAELVEGVDYDLTYSEDLTNAGTVTVTVTGKGNYDGSVDVTYQITPATLTVSTPSASKVYDGEALAAEGSVSGFVTGESAPFATTGSQTLVGSSTNTYAIDWAAEGATAKQSNYVVSEELGVLTVTDGTDDDPVDPSLVINKTHEDGTYALGDTVDFTLTATNVYGEARTMTFVEQEGVEIIGQTVFENVEPGATVSTTARYTVTEADILAGGFTNTATVSFGGGKAFDGKDDVVVEKVENALKVTKTIASAPADGVSFNEGETVSFEVTVTNTGNQTLKDVQVTDKLAGAFLAQGESELIESLAPGTSVTLHYGYTITANDLGKEFRNVAVATAGNGTTGEGETPVIPVAPMSPEPNPDQKPDSKPGSGKPAIPKTADETPDGLMAALADLGLASLAAGLACLFVIPRRREN